MGIEFIILSFSTSCTMLLLLRI